MFEKKFWLVRYRNTVILANFWHFWHFLTPREGSNVGAWVQLDSFRYVWMDFEVIWVRHMFEKKFWLVRYRNTVILANFWHFWHFLTPREGSNAGAWVQLDSFRYVWMDFEVIWVRHMFEKKFWLVRYRNTVILANFWHFWHFLTPREGSNAGAWVQLDSFRYVWMDFEVIWVRHMFEKKFWLVRYRNTVILANFWHFWHFLTPREGSNAGAWVQLDSFRYVWMDFEVIWVRHMFEKKFWLVRYRNTVILANFWHFWHFLTPREGSNAGAWVQLDSFRYVWMDFEVIWVRHMFEKKFWLVRYRNTVILANFWHFWHFLTPREGSNAGAWVQLDSFRYVWMDFEVIWVRHMFEKKFWLVRYRNTVILANFWHFWHFLTPREGSNAGAWVQLDSFRYVWMDFEVIWVRHMFEKKFWLVSFLLKFLAFWVRSSFSNYLYTWPPFSIENSLITIIFNITQKLWLDFISGNFSVLFQYLSKNWRLWLIVSLSTWCTKTYGFR